MADTPTSDGVAQCARLIAAHCPAAGAGYIVFGGFRQYLEFGKDVFVHIFDRDIFAKNTDSV